MSKAGNKHPLKVVEMTCDNFFSTATLKKTTVNRKRTGTNENVKWLKIKQIRFQKIMPHVMQFNYYHDDAELKESQNAAVEDKVMIYSPDFLSDPLNSETPCHM